MAARWKEIKITTPEYMQPFVKQISPKQFYKVDERYKNTIASRKGSDSTGFSNKLVKLNDHISYFGIEVSVMNLRPQTQAYKKRITTNSLRFNNSKMLSSPNLHHRRFQSTRFNSSFERKFHVDEESQSNWE